MISVDDALAQVVAAFRPLPAEVVALEAALGRVLAEDVAARLSQPPADVSAMDGYAVRAADLQALPATLRLIGRSAAGAGFPGSLAAGEAVRILTGAPVPAGADTIVIQEHAELRDERVVLHTGSAVGRHIRRAGQDFAAGEMLLRGGRRLGSRDIGLAAAMNVPWLTVRRRPRVAVVATGDELVLPGEPRGRDQIVDSAGLACAALLRAFGAEPVMLGIAGDDEASLARMLAAARSYDLLLTIGGASVGDLDLVGRVLHGAGFALAFHKVAMRPGKPVLFGRLGELPVLGLPGNPVSACVTLLVFARAAVEAMLGLGLRRDGAAPSALLGCDLPGNDERQDYLRATLARDAAGDLVATPFAVQDSAMLRLFVAADCLVVRPPRAAAARAGQRVVILPLGDDPPACPTAGR